MTDVLKIDGSEWKPRSPDSVNVDDHDNGYLSVYAYPEDGEPVEERILSHAPEVEVREAQERVAAEVNKRNALDRLVRRVGVAFTKLPQHIALSIRHNEHAALYQTLDFYLEMNAEAFEILAEDKAAILATGEMWEIRWYPNTPVGYCTVAAATLERALELTCR